jgi:hypothetical protein
MANEPNISPEAIIAPNHNSGLPGGKVAKGLALAGLSGWFGTVTLYVGGGLIVTLLELVQGTSETGISDLMLLGLYVAIASMYGIPISILLALLIGFPVWRAMEIRERTGVKDCICAGFKVGFSIWLVGFSYFAIKWIGSTFNPISTSGISYWGYGVITHGPAMLFQAFLELLKSVSFALIGAMAGYVAWRVTAYQAPS